MTSWKAVLLSFPVVTVVLAALAVGLIELGRYWGFGLSSLYFLVVPVALAILYLAWYRTLPYVPRGAPVGSGPTSLIPGDSEPFEDPVEEADRLAQEGTAGPPAEEPTVVEDDAPADSPPAP